MIMKLNEQRNESSKLPLDFLFTKPLIKFFASRERKALKIYKHDSDKNNKCLSVGYFGILSVVFKITVLFEIKSILM